MKKTIKIDGKDYELSVNAFTMLKYKDMFKNDIFKDLNIINKFGNKIAGLNETEATEQTLEYWGEIQRVGLQMFFTMSNSELPFKEFCKDIEIFGEEELTEVMELMMSTFQRPTTIQQP